jgi:hypothetical protein
MHILTKGAVYPSDAAGFCVAGSSTCSTKELSIHLTKILSAVKEGQQKYCETVYSRGGINHMWILKNSKDLLDNLQSRSFSQVSSIKTFD